MNRDRVRSREKKQGGRRGTGEAKRTRASPSPAPATFPVTSEGDERHHESIGFESFRSKAATMDASARPGRRSGQSSRIRRQGPSPRRASVFPLGVADLFAGAIAGLGVELSDRLGLLPSL
jgi:hypothetical protein